MSDQTAGLARLREPFPPELIGKLPRVTCGDCSDKRKTCTSHERRRCDVCKAFVSTRHIHLDYVGHADTTDRVLDADLEWTWEPMARDVDPAVVAAAVATGKPDVIAAVLAAAPPKYDLDERGQPVGLWIKLTICGVTRPGYGSVPSGQGDAVKVLIGDALRNAAMRFGVALDLWAKGDRADPAAENATAAGGTAARRRPGTPARQSTDHAWLTDIEGRIGRADSMQELATLANEVEGRRRAGSCEDVHYSHLWEAGKAREAELSATARPTNKDGAATN